MIAGVVDQHIDAAGSLDDVVDQLVRLVAVADVADDDGRVDAALGEIFARPLQLRLVARGDRDACALTPKLARNHQAEAARAAGDDGRAAAEIHRAARHAGLG